MSRKVNNTLVGLFVLGAIALVVVCIALFGSRTFSTRKTSFVCVFEDSVNGLESGARVKFKGVSIGQVSRVLLRMPGQAEGDNAVPVLIEIDGGRPEIREFVVRLSDPDSRRDMLENGLRARLQSQSLLTGLLYVELDIHPGAPARYHLAASAAAAPEIPTLASDLGTLMRALARTTEQLSHIQFAAMGAKADRILAQLETNVAALDLKALNKALVELAASANAILNDPETRRLAPNLNATLQTADATLKTAGQLATRLDTKLDPLAAELAQTAAAGRATLEQLNRLAENLRAHTAPGAPVTAQLDETLRQIAAAAEAVRSLAAYLERRPETLLRGKSEN